MKRLACLSLIVVMAAARGQNEAVIGNVRIQALSDSLIRLEMKGPKGWENRSTFHIQRSSWKAPAVTVKTSPAVGFEMVGKGWSIKTKKDNVSLEDIVITDQKSGKTLWKWDETLPNSVWLPGPSDKPKSWWFADAPRIVPSSRGLIPGTDPNDQTSGWDISNDAPDVYVFLPNGDYKKLRQEFIELTGRCEMPPIYLLGFLHSRYHPYSDKSALELIDKYRQRGFPLDLFVVDTDWRVGASHGYGANTKLFPDMAKFFRDAHAKDVRIMFNDHPEPQAKTALDPKELAYRSEGLTQWLKAGLDIWWYDRNWNVGLREPLPKLRKEVWGMALYRDITLAAKPNLRPAMMANVDGIDNGRRNNPPNVAAHRYPIQWTGDQGANFDFLRFGVENAVHAGVHTTFAYMSEDLGGHVWHPTPEAFTRFMQYGALSPTMRLHYTAGLPDREPWAWGPEIEKICLDYTHLRYRLMPLLYASARENYETGEPLVRRCDLDFPEFEQARRNDQYLLGKGILVAPILSGSEPKVVPNAWSPSGFKASYFGNRDLKGEPVFAKQESGVGFSWGTSSPAPKVPSDNFSARFEGQVIVAGKKAIHLGVRGDDGVRLWIDDKLVVDKWIPQDSVTTFSADALSPGKTYKVRIEYMEIAGNAVCQLVFRDAVREEFTTRDVWIPPGQWLNVWTGETLVGPLTTTVKASFREMPIFVRSGAIMPLSSTTNYFDTQRWEKLTLDCYPHRQASFDQIIYEDDQKSNDYKQDEFRKTRVSMWMKGSSIKLDVLPLDGSSLKQGNRQWLLRMRLNPSWVGKSKALKVFVNGKPFGDWKLLKSKKGWQMPFLQSGYDNYFDVAEIRLTVASASKAYHVEVVLG